MYSNNFVVTVKVNGKILREDRDSVFLPFGSEYSILLKNLNSIRAQVKVGIDGVDATDGTPLIVPANFSLELERYIRNGNLDSGNRFKFIERTQKIEEHRGIRAEDGLVRVEYQFEKQPTEIVEHIFRKYDYYYYPWWPHYSHPYCPYPPYYPHWTLYPGGTAYTTGSSFAPGVTLTSSVGGPIGSATASIGNRASNPGQAENCNLSGITVPGTESNQRFMPVGSFPTEQQKHIIVLRLFGKVGKEEIRQAVEVSRNLECQTCGKSNRSSCKYCSECGTALTLI